MALYIALQSALHILEKWADNNNVLLNTTKTNQLVTIRAKNLRHTKRTENVTITESDRISIYAQTKSIKASILVSKQCDIGKYCCKIF